MSANPNAKTIHCNIRTANENANLKTKLDYLKSYNPAIISINEQRAPLNQITNYKVYEAEAIKGKGKKINASLLIHNEIKS